MRLNAQFILAPAGERWSSAVGVYNLTGARYADPAGPEHLQDALAQDGRAGACSSAGRSEHGAPTDHPPPARAGARDYARCSRRPARGPVRSAVERGRGKGQVHASRWRASSSGRAAAFPAETAPLRLCVLHNSPTVAPRSRSHAGRVGGGRTSLSAQPARCSRAAACDLLFVDASAARGGRRRARRCTGAPMLTVGAVDGFLSRGGMVELVNVNDALRFDVNLTALRAAHLGLSSQVLKLARQVRE